MALKKLKNPFFLFLTAFFWGTAFVAQSVSMDHIGPFTMTCLRSLLGSAALFPVAFFYEKKNPSVPSFRETGKTILLGGLLCGVVLCIASNLQQIGIKYTDIGKAGFITAFYIVLVPVLGIFFKRKTSPVVWMGVVVALIGLYLLCISGSFTVSCGDLLCFFCAIGFSFHILSVDFLAPKVNCVLLSCIQFLVCGLLSAVPMLWLEKPNGHDILMAVGPILYAGLVSSAIAYTLQILGQRDVHPALACLIMSLESVISALSGWVLLHQHLSVREIMGCVVMFAAILLVQLFGNTPEVKKE